MIDKDTLKECSTCHEKKSIFEYSRNVTAKDGLAYQCRPCKTAQNRKWRNNNRKSYEVSREKNRLKNKASGVKSAHDKLHRAVYSGKIKPSDCVVCGEKAQAHHLFGYDFPLEVVWLCTVHHSRQHTYIRRMEEKAALAERDSIVELMKKGHQEYGEGEYWDCVAHSESQICCVEKLLKALSTPQEVTGNKE